jgi:hypothetical protein
MLVGTGGAHGIVSRNIINPHPIDPELSDINHSHSGNLSFHSVISHQCDYIHLLCVTNLSQILCFQRKNHLLRIINESMSQL